MDVAMADKDTELEPEATIPPEAFDVEQWIISMPEIATRPRAIEALRREPRLRTLVLRFMHDMIGTATRLVNFRTAAEVLAALWQVRRLHFVEHWRAKLPNVEFTQCYGTIRNIYTNALHRATGNRQQMGAYDVERKIPDALLPRVTARYDRSLP